MPLRLHGDRRRDVQYQKNHPLPFKISSKLPLIMQSHCQKWGKKVFQHIHSTKCGAERLEREAKKRGQIKGMPDSSCMGDGSHIQNVPSLADVKSHKMAHYWDRKGARWRNRPHIGLKQNDKGRDKGRWHPNISTFTSLRFWQNRPHKTEGVEKDIFFLNILFHGSLYKTVVSDNGVWGQATLQLTHFLHCTWG